MNFRCSGTQLQTSSASVLIKTVAAAGELSLRYFLVGFGDVRPRLAFRAEGIVKRVRLFFVKRAASWRRAGGERGRCSLAVFSAGLNDAKVAAMAGET